MTEISINYLVEFIDPHTHYAHVHLTLQGELKDEVVLKLPVWTPGSYLVREFSKNIEQEHAFDERNESLSVRKLDKNSWAINCAGLKKIHFKYKVYCYELSVRTSWIDADHAYLNGGNVFMYVEGKQHLPYNLEFKPYTAWKKISCSLPINRSKWKRKASNYDMVVDSPIEIGNHKVLNFRSKDVYHEVALYGESNCDEDKLIQDLKAITSITTDIFGEHPCNNYLFIIHHTDNKGGGLEHLYNTTCHVPRWNYLPRANYQKTMGLLAHEYFHLWNVKRIRPRALGPFDYDTENYTRQLWFAEGITSYYDDYILYRSGVLNLEEYLSVIAKNLSDVVNRPGNDVQSLAEASFDAWIKYYRQNENSINSQVSYYGKGAAIAHVLNLILLNKTGGKRSLDDVMRNLYKQYKSNPEIGFTEEEIKGFFQEVAGINFNRFFKEHIYGIKPVNYARYFAFSGLDLINENDKKKEKKLGITTKWEEGKLIIKSINKKYAAYSAGLNVNDEIIAIDGYRVFENYQKIFEHKRIGDKIDLLISRAGIVQSFTVEISINKEVLFNLSVKKNPNSQQRQILKRWLKV